MKPDVYQIITDRIIESLEKGVNPWRKPWNAEQGSPRNAITGRGYNGINWFLLNLHGGGRFLTYNQSKKAGGQVKKGEKGCPVVYWNFFETEKNGEKKTIPFLKYFTVFSLDQCEGLDHLKEEKVEPLDFVPVDKAEATIQGTGAKINHRGAQAFYSPSDDEITLPEKEDFKSVDEYYSTAFHELIHWTGHSDRLKRKGIEGVAAFGSETYSKEELVAEMGAAFLCGEHGIDGCLDNSASYLASWIKRLKGDNKLAIQAAAQAGKASDFIMKRERKSEEGK